MSQEKTIAITRSKDDSEEFIQLITKHNATPITLPTIELVSKGEKIVDDFLISVKVNNPDYSVFMSSKAVKLLIESSKKVSKFEELRLAITNTIVIAVGPKTKEALENENIRVSYMPTRYSSVGVGEVFTKLNAVGKKVIIPRSGASTPFLKDLLEKSDYKLLNCIFMMFVHSGIPLNGMNLDLFFHKILWMGLSLPVHLLLEHFLK